MTWREEMVAKLLLLVARMLCDDPAIAADIKHSANAIHAGRYDRRNAEEASP